MKAHQTAILSLEEYRKLEIESDSKFEFHNGKVYALAGGTINHGLICGNVHADIKVKLEDKKSNCLPFNSDVKLFIEKTNSYVYPDTMVICGKIETSTEYEDAVTNPVLIIEVLSKATASYDRGDKFYFYRQIPTLKEYVLIEQNKHVVDVHSKGIDNDFWKITRYEGLDKTVKFQSIDLELPMERLYLNTKIEL